MKTRTKCDTRTLTRFKTRAVVGAVAWLLLLPVAARSGGVVVNCTEADLRTAMAAGGPVTFACDGTILLADTININADTTLDGSGHQVVISGGNAVRLFRVATNVDFRVLNLTLADGFSRAGSAILNDHGQVQLTGVTLRSNVAGVTAVFGGSMVYGEGGAIWIQSGVVIASRCTFSGNMAMNQPPAEARGGAIYNRDGQLLLERCDFQGNRALGEQVANPFPPYLGTTVAGGAIYNGGEFVADSCSFIENVADAGDGYSRYGSSGGAALGGAVCNSGNLSITRSTFAGNVAAGGNGSQGYTGSTMHDFGLPGGTGGGGGHGDGGALLNRGTASLMNCTIASNAGIGGSGGQGGQGGSGINWGGSGGMGGSGGNGFGGVDGTCNLIHCTLALNGGAPGSGGPGGPGGTGALGNGGTGFPGPDGTAWGATICSGLASSLIASNLPGGNDTFPDPRLGPLTNNGGPTLTMALLPGSPAIDAGDSALAPPTDQRGNPRPVGLAADLGAYEFGCAPPAMICPADFTNTVSAPQDAVVQFTVTAISWCDPAPVVTCVPSSGSLFPVGTTVVVCHAMDANGGSNACSFRVTVRLSNQCPEARIAFGPWCVLSNATAVLLVANEDDEACVIFDGTQSTDADGDALTYDWFADDSLLPFSMDALNTNCLAIGRHEITLMVDDGKCLGQQTVHIEIVTVCDLVEGLIQDIEDTSLPWSKQRPLIDSLKNICKQVGKDEFKYAIVKVEHFQNKLRGELKDYPAEQAQFNAEAQAILDAVNCAVDPHARKHKHDPHR